MKSQISSIVARTAALLLLFSALNSELSTCLAQGTAFTYQGRLDTNGVPVTGAYDMQFSAYDANAAGLVVAGPFPAYGVGLTNGLFTARIDFGAAVFTGAPRWLEISVRPAGGGSFQTLNPRQELTSSPYSIRAQNAGMAGDVSNGVAVKSLNNLRDNITLAAGTNVTLTPSGNTLTIAAAGAGGSGIWSVNANNAYYTAGNVGIGTSTPQGLLDLVTGNGSDNSALFVRADPGSYGRGGIIHHQSSTYGWQELAQNTGGAIDGFLTYHYVNRAAPGTKLASDVLTLRANGNVGIGTNNPQATLHVAGTIRSAGEISSGGPISAAGRVDIATQDALRIRGFQPLITMYDTSAFGLIYPPRRYIQVVGDGMHFLYQPECNAFPCPTGNAVAQLSIAGNGNVGIGTTTPQAKLHVVGTVRTSVLTITGGADIAEPFKMSSAEIPKGSVVIIDEQNPGHLRLSTEAYDTRVAGVVSGANGIQPGISLHQEGAIEGGENVALSGRVYVRASAEFGPIKPGDLLTTSATPGHAMKVGDHGKAHGAILGKAMSGLQEGKGTVLVLVTLQ
jgi:hypothetical protein